MKQAIQKTSSNIDKEFNSDPEIIAIVIQLEKQDKYPLLVFHNVLNVEGKKSCPFVRLICIPEWGVQFF